MSGQRSGHGRCEYASGGCYEGDYHLNRKDGRGVMLLADGSRYEGHFKDGKKCKNMLTFFFFLTTLRMNVCIYVCMYMYASKYILVVHDSASLLLFVPMYVCTVCMFMYTVHKYVRKIFSKTFVYVL